MAQTRAPAADLVVVGTSLPKVDGLAKTTGETKYADDLVLPRMAYGKLLRSSRPHARIRSINVAPALELPGVLAVLTGRDLPTKYGILPVSQDEEALCTEKVRHVGDPVAAVAAVDEETAERACRRIEVEYEDLPAAMTIEEALAQPGEPIHAGRERNVHRAFAFEFGDVDAAFARAAYTREDVFFFQGNTHLPLEQHAAVAQWSAAGKLTLWTSTQTPHYVHRTLAKVLGLPPERIRVIATPVGGGFGGKCDPFSHEICAAKLALVTGRPVKITLTREEVFYAHRGRHPVLMWVKSGWSADGRLVALDFQSFVDGGAYGSYGVASLLYTGALQTVTYKVPAYRWRGVRVFTNKPPCGPKRGHGTPQPRYALECHLDKVAADLGLDPVELRRRNLIEPFSRTVNYLRVTSCGLRECLEAVVRDSGFLEKRGGRLGFGRGVGLAVSAYLCGAGLPIYFNDLPHSAVQIRLDRSGGVLVLCGEIDIGQGSDTMLAMTVAEALGVRPEQVQLVTADTDLTPIDLGSYSSRVTFMVGNAAIEAARKLRAVLLAAAAEQMGVAAGELALAGGRIWARDDPTKTMEFAEAVRLAEAKHGALGATGSYRPPKLAGPFKGSGVGPSPAYSYSACVVEVTCDPETGWVSVDKVWLAHDIGRAINPVLVEGQCEGSIYMALGEALMEEQTFRRGLHKTPSLLEYKSPTTLETPEMHTRLIETVDPEGPFGAKEAGQGPLLPVIPAVANAVADALGVRIDETPITPEKVLKALEAKRAGKEPRFGPAGVPPFDFPPPQRVELPPEWRAGGDGRLRDDAPPNGSPNGGPAGAGPAGSRP